MRARVPRFSGRGPKSPITGPARQAHCVADRPTSLADSRRECTNPRRMFAPPLFSHTLRRIPNRLTRLGNASVSSSYSAVDESGSAYPVETHAIRVSTRSGCLARFDHYMREGSVRSGVPSETHLTGAATLERFSKRALNSNIPSQRRNNDARSSDRPTQSRQPVSRKALQPLAIRLATPRIRHRWRASCDGVTAWVGSTLLSRS